jgi:hypothetical protein
MLVPEFIVDCSIVQEYSEEQVAQMQEQAKNCKTQKARMKMVGSVPEPSRGVVRVTMVTKDQYSVAERDSQDGIVELFNWMIQHIHYLMDFSGIVDFSLDKMDTLKEAVQKMMEEDDEKSQEEDLLRVPEHKTGQSPC